MPPTIVPHSDRLLLAAKLSGLTRKALEFATVNDEAFLAHREKRKKKQQQQGNFLRFSVVFESLSAMKINFSFRSLYRRARPGIFTFSIFLCHRRSSRDPKTHKNTTFSCPEAHQQQQKKSSFCAADRRKVFFFPLSYHKHSFTPLPWIFQALRFFVVSFFPLRLSVKDVSTNIYTNCFLSRCCKWFLRNSQSIDIPEVLSDERRDKCSRWDYVFCERKGEADKKI